MSTIQISEGATSVLVDTRPAVSKLLQLPSVIANPGRVLMIKDFYGTAGNSSFTISTTGTDYIEDVIRSYTFSNSFGSVNLCYGIDHSDERLYSTARCDEHN